MAKNRHDSDVAFIQAMAELLTENDLSEVQVKRDYGTDESLNVRVTRAAPAPLATTPAPSPGPARPAAGAAPAEPPVTASPQAPASDPALDPDAVTSPMVGTAYLRPEPAVGPFVSVGDEIAAGQTLLIIEAMKTMNHIPAPRSGQVTRILVDDGMPVEYGTPLIVIT